MLDAHLPPTLALWVTAQTGIACFSLSYLGLKYASDETIFAEARSRKAVVITKDIDFLELQQRLGTPPKVIWLTCGNTSRERLQQIFAAHLPTALAMLETADLVEISGK